MNILFIECTAGATGGMLMGALLELIPGPEAFIERMNGLGLPGIHLAQERVTQNGISGTRILVGAFASSSSRHSSHKAPPPVHPRSARMAGHIRQSTPMPAIQRPPTAALHARSYAIAPCGSAGIPEIEKMICSLPISSQEKTSVLAVYRLLAKIETQAYGRPGLRPETGMADTVAYIVGVCLLVEMLSPCEIAVSPLCLNNGRDENKPCNFTAGALLEYFAARYTPQPPLSITGTGCGISNKECPAPSCIHAFLGTE